MRLALALLPLLATPALADAVTYRGTIGSREAVFEFTEPSDGAVAGRFAFLDEGKSMPLNPVSNDGNSWTLAEEGLCTPDTCTFDDDGDASNVPVTAQWQLTLDGTTLTGTRTGTGKSKQQAIAAQELGRRPFEGEAIPGTLRDNFFDVYYEPTLDPTKAVYELALTDVPLVEQSRGRVGDAEIAMMVDPRTKFEFPHVIDLPGNGDVDAANAILDEKHAALSLWALDCLSTAYIAFGGNQWNLDQASLGYMDEETVEFSFGNSKLISWKESGSTWCGGAHPDNHVVSFTYDLTTGKPFDFSQVLRGWTASSYSEPGPVDVAAARKNPEEYDWQPDDALIAFIRARIPVDLLGEEPELAETCFGEDAIRGYVDLRFAPGPSVVFTNSGFPHVIGVCDGDLFTVPLAELGDLLTPEAMSYFAD